MHSKRNRIQAIRGARYVNYSPIAELPNCRLCKSEPDSLKGRRLHPAGHANLMGAFSDTWSPPRCSASDPRPWKGEG